MTSNNVTPAGSTQPSLWKKLQNKRWSLRSLRSTETKLRSSSRGSRSSITGIKRMLSSHFGTTPKASTTSLSSPLANELTYNTVEETATSKASQVFSRRLTSYTTASSVHSPHPFINYNFRPPHRDSGARSSTAAEADEDAYSNDGEPSGNEHDRRNFKDIRDISRTALEGLVLHLIVSEEELPFSSCRVTQRKEGSFHHAVFLNIERKAQTAQEYVLKTPAHGTREEWHVNDDMALQSEAQLMQHICHHTGCPVPEVIEYDGSPENAIGAPYILIKKIEGISAMDMWVGQPYRTIPDAELHLNADDPSPELEQKRITFLRSLAQAMSELVPLEFKYTGIPGFADLKDKHPSHIGPVWRWHPKTVMEKLTSGGSFDTSKAFFAAGLDKVCRVEHDESSGTYDSATNDVWIAMNIVMSSAPFAITGSSHIDNDGNVTGIIDWDGCAAVPRCLGYTSMPTFLRRDWLPDYNIARLPHLTWALDRYREVYAEAMDEFCKSPDAKYTRKSPMYQLVLAALDKDAQCIDVVETLLHEIPEFRRVDVNAFCRRLGHGWPAAEEALKAKIAEWLKPE